VIGLGDIDSLFWANVLEVVKPNSGIAEKQEAQRG
jgi:hypothetical protein